MTVDNIQKHERGLYSLSVEYDHGDVMHKTGDMIFYMGDRYEIIEIRYGHIGAQKISSRAQLIMRHIR